MRRRIITLVLTLFSSRVRTDVVDHYPDLARLRTAAKSGDWGAVSAFFGQLPARADQSFAVRLVANVSGSEGFLQRAVDSDRDSALARTLLGARFIVLAWQARGRAWARYVSGNQATVFHDYLGRAERVLADATAIDPGNAAAWTERITSARGLGLGADEARRRYAQAAEHCDAPYVAQTQLIQNLCPKWGGSTAEIHTFARECLRDAKAGSLGGAIVANAHTEHALSYNEGNRLSGYLNSDAVREEVSAAAAHTVLHADFQPVHGWVDAHSVFAFVLYLGNDRPRAARHFAALGNRVNPYPWEQVYGKWQVAFRHGGRSTR